MSKTIRPLLRSFGGKYYLVKWLISLLPNDYSSRVYAEQFFGGGSLFWNLPNLQKAIINDIDSSIIAVYKVLRDDFGWFCTEIRSWPYDRKTFDVWYNTVPASDKVAALKEVILRRMSRGSMKKTFSTSSRLRGGQNECKNSWETSLQNLELYHKKLQGVEICCDSAYNNIRRIDGQNVFQYLDPPYLPATRKVKKVYDHEMTYDEHSDLLDLLNSCKSKIMLSGYESTLYIDKLKNWNQHYKVVKNNSGQNKKKEKRIEVVWTNY